MPYVTLWTCNFKLIWRLFIVFSNYWLLWQRLFSYCWTSWQHILCLVFLFVGKFGQECLTIYCQNIDFFDVIGHYWGFDSFVLLEHFRLMFFKYSILSGKIELCQRWNMILFLIFVTLSSVNFIRLCFILLIAKNLVSFKSNRNHYYTDKLTVKTKTVQLLPAHLVSVAYHQQKGGCWVQTYPHLLAKLILLNL